MDNNNHRLFELLRQKRNEIAKEANLEPFKILHNKHLDAIVKRRPKTVEEIANIKGIGKKKAIKYGPFILEIVSSFITSKTEVPQEEKVYSVSEFIDFLNQIITLQRAVIQGEVSQINPKNGYKDLTLGSII